MTAPPVSGELLRREIGEQPAVLAATLRDLEAPARELAGRMRQRDVPFVVVAGRGSSANAGQYARYLFEVANLIPVVQAAPSVVTMYRRLPAWSQAALIGISQSGQISDVVELVAAARADGALTVALTNHAGSPLAGSAELALVTPAGREASIPATKTYTAALAALALVAQALGTRGRTPGPAGLAPGDLARLPAAASDVLDRESDLASAARALSEIGRCLVVGRGFNRSSAFETALKIQETSYVLAQAHGASDLLHGPVAVVDRGFSVIGLLCGGPTAPSVMDALEQAHRRGARVLVLSDGDVDEAALEQVSDERIHLDSGLPEPLSPIAFAIAGQLLALHLALAKGLRPETPRALEKVTVTG